MKRWLGELILLTASLLWGTCFVFQKMGMDFMGPFTLSALRFLIGGSFLLPVIFYFEKKQKKKPSMMVSIILPFLIVLEAKIFILVVSFVVLFFLWLPPCNK